MLISREKEWGGGGARPPPFEIEGGAWPPSHAVQTKNNIYLRYSRDLWDSDSGVHYCMLLHVHGMTTDNLDIVTVAKEFVRRNERRITFFIFWKFLILIIISICNVTVYLIIIVYCQAFGIACQKLGCGSGLPTPQVVPTPLDM